MICGVDEAGKGPVIGPMVVAAVLVDNAKQIENAGFKDSKLLTVQKRRELFNLIKLWLINQNMKKNIKNL